MAHKDKHPSMGYIREWDTSEPEEYEKFKKNVNGTDLIACVPITDGSRGMEHLVSVVWEAFDKARVKLAWTVEQAPKTFQRRTSRPSNVSHGIDEGRQETARH